MGRVHSPHRIHGVVLDTNPILPFHIHVDRGIVLRPPNTQVLALLAIMYHYLLPLGEIPIQQDQFVYCHDQQCGILKQSMLPADIYYLRLDVYSALLSAFLLVDVVVKYA